MLNERQLQHLGFMCWPSMTAYPDTIITESFVSFIQFTLSYSHFSEWENMSHIIYLFQVCIAAMSVIMVPPFFVFAGRNEMMQKARNNLKVFLSLTKERQQSQS
jgi:hypothetical protein